MRIDLEASEIHDLKPGYFIETATEIRVGDLLKVKRAGPKKMVFSAVDEGEARKSRGFIYRVVPGSRKDTVHLVVAARSSRPDITFGIFDFNEFQRWMLRRYSGIVGWLDESIPVYGNEVPDYQTTDVFRGAALYAKDEAYLAVLSLAIKYSLYEDLVDGTHSARELILDVEGEPAIRTSAMLEYHARWLPARIDDYETFQKRVASVACLFVPIAIYGFEFPIPACQDVRNKLPGPLRRKWKSHKHKDEPLCQFLVATFYFAFRFLVPEGKERCWNQLIACLWDGWENHLLDVHIALQDESINGGEVGEA